jgi:imidazolonepropionase
MNNKRWDNLWINAQIATMAPGSDYGLIQNAALAVKDDKIAWVGKMADLPENVAATITDAEGRCITPGFIDCHTHLVYAGNRSAEFAMRLAGETYATIAASGGGIRSTVSATRQASEAALLEQSLMRARALMLSGVTTVEIKSGYGLDLVTERKILRVAKAIGRILPLSVKTTFLGAHALPEEFLGRADDYIDMVCEEMLPILAEEDLIDYVDVFCETIGFTVKQAKKVFLSAKKQGLPVKCHAEQLSDSGGAILAADFSALSVDHLEHLSAAGVQAIAKSGTVAVLLPGAFYFLNETHFPPIHLLRQHQVPIAIATDCNPGTSPVTSLLLMMNMACILFHLTPAESLAGVTRHAAKALGVENTRGTLEVGKRADFLLWEVEHPLELVYAIGLNPLFARVFQGLT